MKVKEIEVGKRYLVIGSRYDGEIIGTVTKVEQKTRTRMYGGSSTSWSVTITLPNPYGGEGTITRIVPPAQIKRLWTDEDQEQKDLAEAERKRRANIASKSADYLRSTAVNHDFITFDARPTTTGLVRIHFSLSPAEAERLGDLLNSVQPTVRRNHGKQEKTPT